MSLNEGEMKKLKTNNSVYVEKMLEALFISELKQEALFRYGMEYMVRVAYSEIDDEGVDVILTCAGKVRHVQLKAMHADTKEISKPIHEALARTNISGCVVVLVWAVNPETNRINFKYKFFGGEVGQPLPSIDEHRKASKPGRTGKKKPNTRAVSRTRFEPVADVSALLQRLFGLEG